MDDLRQMQWEGRSLQTLRAFPADVRWEFGQALFLAQQGKRSSIASPMKKRLSGIVELRADEKGDTYRLYYTLKCPDYVFVLYCHKKKAKQGIGIPKHEEDLIVQRYREALQACVHLREEEA
jgi:phage-related protein